MEITPNGVRTTDGEYELDVLIFATGFDAVDGNYTKIDMRGRDGITMNEKWADGPTGYLGMMNSHFPNAFMILGPNGPFTNLPPSIETQVEWISDTVKYMIENDISTDRTKHKRLRMSGLRHAKRSQTKRCFRRENHGFSERTSQARRTRLCSI